MRELQTRIVTAVARIFGQQQIQIKTAGAMMHAARASTGLFDCQEAIKETMGTERRCDDPGRVMKITLSRRPTDGLGPVPRRTGDDQHQRPEESLRPLCCRHHVASIATDSHRKAHGGDAGRIQAGANGTPAVDRLISAR
jgi:hypothetical protein